MLTWMETHSTQQRGHSAKWVIWVESADARGECSAGCTTWWPATTRWSSSPGGMCSQTRWVASPARHTSDARNGGALPHALYTIYILYPPFRASSNIGYMSAAYWAAPLPRCTSAPRPRPAPASGSPSQSPSSQIWHMSSGDLEHIADRFCILPGGKIIDLCSPMSTAAKSPVSACSSRSRVTADCAASPLLPSNGAAKQVSSL